MGRSQKKEKEKKKRWLASLFLFLRPEKWMETCFVSGEGRGLSLILSSPRVGRVPCQEELLFTPTCLHGTFEAFVKRGFGREPLKFCHSQTPLLLEMTMLEAGCTYLSVGREIKFHILFPLSEEVSPVLVLVFCTQENMNFLYSLIKAALTWYYKVTDKPLCVFVTVYLWLVKRGFHIPF